MPETMPGSLRRATPLPQAAAETAATVRLHGRWLCPRWSLDARRRLRLELHDPYGLLPPLRASAEVDWMCREDEVVLRDSALAAALQHAGLLRAPHARLHAGGSVLPLARLSAAALAALPDEMW